MNNNDILRVIRYAFDFRDEQMISIFALGELEVTRPQVSDWMKRDEDEEFQPLYDIDFAHFLNGLIAQNRGKKEGPAPKAEKKLNNNQIFRKLRIALDLKEDDVLEILSSVGMHISPHELSAFFRKSTQSQYRPCKDQILRKFLQGIQKRYRKED